MRHGNRLRYRRATCVYGMHTANTYQQADAYGQGEAKYEHKNLSKCVSTLTRAGLPGLLARVLLASDWRGLLDWRDWRGLLDWRSLWRGLGLRRGLRCGLYGRFRRANGRGCLCGFFGLMRPCRGLRGAFVQCPLACLAWVVNVTVDIAGKGFAKPAIAANAFGRVNRFKCFRQRPARYFVVLSRSREPWRGNRQRCKLVGRGYVMAAAYAGTFDGIAAQNATKHVLVDVRKIGRSFDVRTSGFAGSHGFNLSSVGVQTACLLAICARVLGAYGTQCAKTLPVHLGMLRQSPDWAGFAACRACAH